MYINLMVYTHLLCRVHFRSKVFIRFPATLFNTEDLYQQKKHDLGESKQVPTL